MYVCMYAKNGRCIKCRRNANTESLLLTTDVFMHNQVKNLNK